MSSNRTNTSPSAKNPWIQIALASTLLLGVCTPAARAAAFGRVVPIGGSAADIALDEARGVLYIANFSANRVDVMSTSDFTIGHSESLSGHPGSLAVSPDGKYLVVTLFGNPSDGSAGGNALTVINLDTGERRSYGLAFPPLAVAFGIDGLALILTTKDFQLFDPVSGLTEVIQTVDNVAKTLPVSVPTFPPEITTASMVALRDGTKIFGFTDSILFSYRVDKIHEVIVLGYSAAPTLGPRALSVSQDGRSYMAGWGLFGCGEGFLGDCNARGPVVAQYPGATGKLNVGTVAFQSSTKTIFAQASVSNPAPPAPNSQTVCLPDGRCVTVTDAPAAKPVVSNLPPSLLIMDSDNLNVRERIQLVENLAGKSVFNADESVLYAISDSGVTVFDMAQLRRAPRVLVAQEDVVFRGNFCDRRMITQELNITDQGGGNVPFTICAAGQAQCGAVEGISITPTSGVTPARVRITVDPVTLKRLGTSAFTYELRSSTAVNMPPPPNTGAIETDYVSNVRARVRILVNNREPEYRGAFVNLPGRLVDILADPGRDRVYILRQDKNQVLVYNSSNFSLIATLRTSNTPTQMAITFDRHYLLVGHDNSQLAYVFDLDTLEATRPIRFPFGHYPRSIAASGNAILAAVRSAAGPHAIDVIDMAARAATILPDLGVYKNEIDIKTVLTASPNGGSILAAMPDGRVLLYNATSNMFTAGRKDVTELKGAYAASSFGRYIVGRYIFNESLVPVRTLETGDDSPSGTVFVDQNALQTAAASTAAAGTIRRLDLSNPVTSLPTRIVEAPLLSDSDFPFTRTLATVFNRSAVVSLTTSGFTVLPWAFDAATLPPRLDRIVNAADQGTQVAPGSLVSVIGSQLSPVNIANNGTSLPSALGDSCLAVNGVAVPMIFVSPTRINAQLPYQVDGNATLILRTPGGTSDGLNFTILPAAPGVFRSGASGPETDLPTVFRGAAAELVTISNPIHPQDEIVIYLTGMGRTDPSVDAGIPAPSDPLATAIIPTRVTLGGVSLPIKYSGLAPGQVGVYQINAVVPFRGVPTGFDIPLTITQEGSSTTLAVRVVD